MRWILIIKQVFLQFLRKRTRFACVCKLRYLVIQRFYRVEFQVNSHCKFYGRFTINHQSKILTPKHLLNLVENFSLQNKMF
jgi:hypothetical protein